MHTTVVIQPASLWTQVMSVVIADLAKPGRCTVNLTQDSRADLLGEFRQ